MKLSTSLMMFSCFLTALVWGQEASNSKDFRESFKEEPFFHRTFNRYDVNPGFAKYSFGLNAAGPLKGWNEVDNKWGIRYRRNHFDLGINFWNGIEEGKSERQEFSRISLGYITPLTALGVGKRPLGIIGARAQGILALGATKTSSDYGIYLAPGAHLELPFCSVGARANLEYTFGGGINVFPEISLTLDALWDVFDPNKVRTGTFHSSSTTVSPLGGGWYQVTHKEYNSPFYIKDIGPFWSVTPRVGIANRAWTNEPYKTYGLGVSGRISYFGADIYIGKGKLVTGIVENANDVDQTVKNEFDNDQVKGLVNTTEITFEGSANIVGLFLTIFKKNAISKMGNTTTPLNRFNFHLGVVRVIPGKVNYQNQNVAVAYTDQFFLDHPEVERTALNDPLIHKKEWGVTYGVSYEMGAVGIRVNNKLSKTAGRGTTIEAYYLLPLSRIGKRLKEKGE